MNEVRRAVLVLLLLGTAPVCAQSDADVSTAREIAKEGLSDYDAGRYAEASEKLSRALEVVGVPTLALYTARANAKMGRLVRALDLYLLATRLRAKGASESVQLEAQREAERERAELGSIVPRLTIAIEGAGDREVEVTLDGRIVPLSQLGTAQQVDPGNHAIVARRGSEEVKVGLSIEERETKTTVLTFGGVSLPPTSPGVASHDVTALHRPNPKESKPSASATEQGATQRILGWVGVGIGGVGLLTGAGLGSWLLFERSRLEDAGCVGASCYEDQAKDVEHYNAVRTASLVGFVAGTAFAATGAALLLASPRQGSSTKTAFVLGPGFASIEGYY